MNSCSFRSPSWLGFIILTVVIIQEPAFGQGKSEKIPELNPDSTLINWISRNVRSDNPLEDFHLDFIPNKLPVFLPKDLPAPYYDPQTPDNPVRVNGKWLWPVEGTGRVYQWNRVSGKMERLDSTVFFGNTFGSIEFALDDSLYSLGGYGFWKTNGQLRYYDTLSRGWNIRALNMEIPVKERNGYWLSSNSGQLYYVNQPVRNEAVAGKKGDVSEDASFILKLNIRSGNWVVLGKAEAHALQILRTAHRIATTPIGELYLEMPPSSGKAFILDYENNRLLQMSVPWVRQLVHITNRPAEQPKIPAKCFAYATDQGLHFINTLGESRMLGISADSYIDTGDQLYTPVSRWSEALAEWALPVTSVFFLVFALVWNVTIWRRQSARLRRSDQVVFDDAERMLIRTWSNQPEKILTTDDINAVLGTHRKNPDLQRKYRSERIKAINEKCFRLLSTSESLILTERSPDDKRVVLYRINVPMFERVEKHIS